MDLRYTFNEDVKNYDKWRPTYCNELFHDIVEYSNMTKDKLAIEIGIGTGQATKPFLDIGCSVTAIELGEELAEYCRCKYEDYKNLDVKLTSFENYNGNEFGFDLFYSATAFHWIPEEIGYLKAYKLLKENGTLALFWNKPSSSNDPLNEELQKLYQKYRPSNVLKEYNSKRNIISESIEKYGFRDLNMKTYSQKRVFDSEEYICLLETYSDHRSMEKNIKNKFYSEISDLIISNGDQFTITDTIDLYLAKK